MAAAGRQTFPNEIEGLPDRSARKDRGTDTCRSADVRQNGQHHRRLRMSAILSRLPRIFQFQPRRPLDRPHLPGRHLGGESVPILLPGLSQAGRSPAQAFRPEGRHQRGRNTDTYGYAKHLSMHWSIATIRSTRTLRSNYTRIVTYSPIQVPCCSPLPNIIKEATAYAATRPCKRCSC